MVIGGVRRNKKDLMKGSLLEAVSNVECIAAIFHRQGNTKVKARHSTEMQFFFYAPAH